MKGRRCSVILSAMIALVMALSLTPAAAFAAPGSLAIGVQGGEDTTSTVKVYADSANGDQNVAKGNVTVTTKYDSQSAYGVYVGADNGKRATVTVGDVSVNCSNASFQYGVYAFEGTSSSAGSVLVSTGNITSNGTGALATANDNGGDCTVNVKGRIQATSYGVYVNGLGNTGKGVFVAVDGDAISTGAEGIRYQGEATTQDVLVTGTVSGATYGVVTSSGSPKGINQLTVWKVVAPNGLFMKMPTHNTYETDDASAKAANYIIKCGNGVTPLASDGSALATSHGYPVAKEGEKVLVTATNGNRVTKAYNDGAEVATKDADGNFYVTVPRGGGVYLTADIGNVPAHDPVPVPAGKDLAYNGTAQTGVAAGAGYTLTGTTSATNAGAYQATATLKNGYKWTDGTTAEKSIQWSITQASNTAKAKKSSVKKTVSIAKLKKKARNVSLPKVTSSFGAAKWKVAKKDKKKVLKLSGDKVKVKKGAKKGIYTIKLKASVPATANYSAASTKTVTVKVTVR